MTDKELFIEYAEEALKHIAFESNEDEEKVMNYLNSLKTTKSVEITEKGAEILQYMQNTHETCNNTFTAKYIGEGIDKSSRIVSGSLKKLVNDGFVNKLGGSPVSYAISAKGIEYQFDK